MRRKHMCSAITERQPSPRIPVPSTPLYKRSEGTAAPEGTPAPSQTHTQDRCAQRSECLSSGSSGSIWRTRHWTRCSPSFLPHLDQRSPRGAVDSITHRDLPMDARGLPSTLCTRFREHLIQGAEQSTHVRRERCPGVRLTCDHDHGAGINQALRLRVGQHDAVVTFGSGDPHQCGFADASTTETK